MCHRQSVFYYILLILPDSGVNLVKLRSFGDEP
jgi:hypothetical protein